MVTPTMKRYTAEIYRLQEDNPYVSLSTLSEHVLASLQAVSRTIGRLKEGEYIEHEPYRGVRLTPAGEKIAMAAIRRHRVIEVFLVKVLKFGWDEVHDFSDHFEAGVNAAIEDRIFEVAGRPTRCPHGEPIPSREGVMPQVQDASLVEMEIGRSYCISRVRVHEPEKLKYLGELNLFPQTTFDLISKGPFRGPVRIQSNRREIILGYELATALFVEPSSAT